ncbi:hypothetical protein AAC387_Pa09g0221 [Persea americana]
MNITYLGKWEREKNHSPHTSSLIDENNVFGREGDKMKITEILMSDGALSVIPVVGMGGLGKTTLVQLVYNDDTVKQHFGMRMCVCIGEEFDVRRITRGHYSLGHYTEIS